MTTQPNNESKDYQNDSSAIRRPAKKSRTPDVLGVSQPRPGQSAMPPEFADCLVGNALEMRRRMRACGIDIPAHPAFPEEQLAPVATEHGSSPQAMLKSQRSFMRNLRQTARRQQQFMMSACQPLNPDELTPALVNQVIHLYTRMVLASQFGEAPTINKVLAAIRKGSGLLGKDLKRVTPNYRDLIAQALAGK